MPARSKGLFFIFGGIGLLGCLSLLVYIRHRAAPAQDMSKLRKIALAGLMYKEAEGEVPFQMEMLLQNGSLQKTDLDLAEDPTAEGFYNYYGLRDNFGRYVDYRRSPLDLGSINAKGNHMKEILARPAAGWAVAFVEPNSNGSFSDYPDHYLRIRIDGSISRLKTPIHLAPSMVVEGRLDEQLATNDFFGEPK